MRTTTRLGTIAVAATALVAMATPAYAVAPSVLDIESASLLARGAAVQVSLTYVCDSVSGSGFVNVEVRQTSKAKQVNIGSGGAQAVCTGEPQQAQITVSSGRAFKKGEAVVLASVGSCDEFSCSTSPVRTEVVTLQ